MPPPPPLSLSYASITTTHAVAQGVWKSVWLRIVESAAIDVVVPVITGTVVTGVAGTVNTSRFTVTARVFLRVVSSHHHSTTARAQV